MGTSLVFIIASCRNSVAKVFISCISIFHSFPVCVWNPDSLCRPPISSAKRNFIDSSPEASSFMRGARVLARREADGYYYLGHIAQEVKGSRERFLIEFDRSGTLKGKAQLRTQETPLYDILHYEDARRQPLAPGDRVLAPWEARAERFGPGTVLKVLENKEARLESVFREEEEMEDKGLKAENVPNEVQPCLEEDNEVIEPKKSPQREMAHAVVDTAVNTDSWLMETVHKEEADSRQQDAETEALFKHKHGLFESRVAEAPIQHSKGNPSMGTSALVPFKCQSFFDRVNQSLQKDSLTIRSALLTQRPHSTSSVQLRRSTTLSLLKDKRITKSILNGVSQERWKEMDFNRAKIEHKRRQEEQRQLKREQQQDADGIQRQLRRDSQRQRLRQRISQELEKRLEQEDRALQHMALLQAARAERSRKESLLPEEEKRKASQRLQFLKTQRVQREELQAKRNERSFEQEKERLDFLRSRMQSRQEMLEQESREQDRQQKKQQAAKGRVFQSRDRSRQKVEKEGQKLSDLQQYLREQNLLMLRASLLA
ncbi:uncharacterized protein AAGF69_003578 isoform 4-T6 [Amazona ochrocephala]